MGHMKNMKDNTTRSLDLVLVGFSSFVVIESIIFFISLLTHTH